MMNVDTRNRAELKAYFVKNAIPTESNFAELIEAMLNQQDDQLAKSRDNPLSIGAASESTAGQPAINFYRNFSSPNPDWSLSLNPRSDPNDAASARPGFSISDGQGNSRLFIDQITGNIGIATTDPTARLHVINVPQDANGNTLILGPTSASNLRLGYHSDYSWIQSHGSRPLAINPRGNNVGIGTTSPAERLDVNGNVKSGALTIGPWPANPGGYVFFGTSALDQSNADHYALLQKVGGGDAGRTYLNSPVAIQFRIKNDDKMVLLQNGNVGVGATNPSFGLDVRGTDGWIGSGDNSQSIGGWRLGRWPAYNANTWVYLSRSNSTAYQDLAVGTLYAGGAVRFGTADDLAEMTPVKAEDSLEPGDIVIIDTPQDNRVLLSKSNEPYDYRVAGVISDPSTAGLIIGGSQPTDIGRKDLQPVALAGRVLTKVTLENGPIFPGDLLTTSPYPGMAMKATRPGFILGKALQAVDSGSTKNGVAKIWVLISLGWFGHESAKAEA